VRKNLKLGDLSDFQKGQIIGAHLAGESVTKTATLFAESRATVSNVMLAYDNSGQESTLAERDRLSYIKKDCFKKSRNYCSMGESTTKYFFNLEDPVSTKTVRYELHKSNIYVGLQRLNL
jgi:hypothetical protein